MSKMISVIIPVYNHAMFLEETIRSCLQDPAVAEILITDDGSQDRSQSIISFFASAYPDVITDMTNVPNVNIGAPQQLNRLWKAAKGEWIAILNSDDRFCLGRFRNLERLAASSGADLVFGNCEIIGPEGQLLGTKYPIHDVEYAFPHQVDIVRLAEAQDWFFPLLNQNFIATTSNIVVRKSLLERLGGFADYRYVHDWDFFIRASMNGTLRYDPGMWTSYRIHSTNTISESDYKVKNEACNMFETLISSFECSDLSKNVSTGQLVRSLISGNRYLEAPAPLALLSKDHPDPVIIEGLKQNVCDIQHFTKSGDIPSHVAYVFAPQGGNIQLTENQMRNLVLSCFIGQYDLCLAMTSRRDRGNSPAAHLRDISLVRREYVAAMVGANFGGKSIRGRLVWLPTDPIANTYTLESLIKPRVTLDEDEFFIGPSNRANRVSSVSTVLLPTCSHLKNESRPIVFVFPGFLAVGGAENILIEIMRKLKTLYAFVIICTEKLEVAQGSCNEQALSHCEAIYDLAETLNQSRFLSALSWLKDVYNPKLVFITNGSMWQMSNAFAIRKLFREAAFIDQQVYDSIEGWINWFDHLGVRSSDRFIAINKKIQKRFSQLGISGEQVDLIYHPVDSERIEQRLSKIDVIGQRQRFGIESTRPVIAFVGRMVDQKRPHLALDLAHLALARAPSLQFVMVGQGTLSDSIAQRIAHLALDNVIRIENIAFVEDLFSVTDILLVLSAYEGLPLVVIEAMCSGVPVLASDVGDISLVLEEYGSGRVFPANTEVEVIFSFLERMLLDLPSVRLGSEAAAEKVRKTFGSDKIAAQYDKSFQDALSEKVHHHSM